MIANPPRTNRTERIQARLTEEAKSLLESAAAMEGVPLSEFVLSSALQRAVETVQAHTSARLSARDSRAFAEALAAPPAPNAALRAARDRYLTDVER